MAQTDADICNLALLKVGEKQLIDDLTADTTEAKTCEALYSTSRDALLEMVPWPFATRHALLGLLEDHTTTPVTQRTGFAYVYALPADCLVPRYIWSGARNPSRDAQIPFDIEDDAVNDRVLLTDMQNAELVYTRAVTEVGKFSPLFCEALSWKLAYELTMAIPVKSQLGLAMIQGFRAALAEAAASVFRHQTPSAAPRPTGVTVR